MTYTTRMRAYAGTDYFVENVPPHATRAEVLAACKVEDGWWISGFHIYGNTAVFNVDFD